MSAHEERVSRSGRSRTDAFAWYRSTTITPPSEVDTDDEFEDEESTRPYMGRFVECRKYTQREAHQFLSKYRYNNKCFFLMYYKLCGLWSKIDFDISIGWSELVAVTTGSHIS